jgi:hypothetical protein
MGGSNIVPLKCEICGREGQPQSFKICPDCKRVVGLECWQPKFQRVTKADSKYPNCRHRLHGPSKTKGIRLNP